MQGRARSCERVGPVITPLDGFGLEGRLADGLFDGPILAEGVEERLSPALLVTGTTQSVVQDPPGLGGQIAAGVVPEEEMGQEQISSPGQEGVRIRELRGLIEAERVPADGERAATPCSANRR